MNHDNDDKEEYDQDDKNNKNNSNIIKQVGIDELCIDKEDNDNSYNDGYLVVTMLSSSPSKLLSTSPWKCESMTPMTSRPHYCTLHHTSHHPIQNQSQHDQQQQQQQQHIGSNNHENESEYNDNNNNNNNNDDVTLLLVPSLLNNTSQSTSLHHQQTERNERRHSTAAPETTRIKSRRYSEYQSPQQYHNISSSPLLFGTAASKPWSKSNSGYYLKDHIKLTTTTPDQVESILAVGVISARNRRTTSNGNNQSAIINPNIDHNHYNDIFVLDDDLDNSNAINVYQLKEKEQEQEDHIDAQRLIKEDNYDNVHDETTDSIQNNLLHYNNTNQNKNYYYYYDETMKGIETTTLSNNMTSSLSPITTQVTPVTTSSTSTATATTTTATASSGNSSSIVMCIMYGCINATIVLPILMSFGSIIYCHDIFRPYLKKLISLTVFSGIVHQITFSTFSSLPFAVGQVQDAGLIFLSSMASTIVQHCQQQQQVQVQQQVYDDRNNSSTSINEYNMYTVDETSTKTTAIILATVTIILGCCTAVLGIALVAIGYFGLAQYVQLLPTSVVGGYLAFIGYFCGKAGIGLMAGTSDISLYQLLTPSTLQFIVPGLVSGIGIYIAVRTLRHMAVLPTCIFLLLVVFHITLWILNVSVVEATKNGWIRSFDTDTSTMSTTTSTSNNNGQSSFSSSSWYDTWDYLRIDLVDWTVVPKLIFTELSMIFVVALSSSLDVAAIELELRDQATQQQQQQQQQQRSATIKLPLDYNRELQTVGLSNIISGCTGGYTGSYIFSQSIFSLRAGIQSRLAGYVLAICQFIVIILPVSILSYVPNFLFGSMLTMICVDLLYEWLWDVRNKVSTTDYLMCWVTFVSILLLGNVEYGILFGLAIYIGYNRLLFPMFERFVSPNCYQHHASQQHHQHLLVKYDKIDDDNNENQNDNSADTDCSEEQCGSIHQKNDYYYYTNNLHQGSPISFNANNSHNESVRTIASTATLTTTTTSVGSSCYNGNNYGSLPT